MTASEEDHTDAKTKMREALERKKETEHARAESAVNTGPIHASEVSGAGGKRMFRRKSG